MQARRIAIPPPEVKVHDRLRTRTAANPSVSLRTTLLVTRIPICHVPENLVSANPTAEETSLSQESFLSSCTTRLLSLSASQKSGGRGFICT